MNNSMVLHMKDPLDMLQTLTFQHITEPVSYTHLDVYKRQERNGRVIFYYYDLLESCQRNRKNLMLRN